MGYLSRVRDDPAESRDDTSVASPLLCGPLSLDGTLHVHPAAAVTPQAASRAVRLMDGKTIQETLQDLAKNRRFVASRAQLDLLLRTSSQAMSLPFPDLRHARPLASFDLLG